MPGTPPSVFSIYRYAKSKLIKVSSQSNQKWYKIPIPYHLTYTIKNVYHNTFI